MNAPKYSGNAPRDPFYPKVLHLLPRRLLKNPGYNDDVRYYTTKTLNGGTTFTCVFCEHNVTTLDFNHTEGNRRTQAASAMNEHAKQLHSTRVRELAPIKINSY